MPITATSVNVDRYPLASVVPPVARTETGMAAGKIQYTEQGRRSI
jgi:hypothetical protein